jgi:UDP-N-acetyl-2-amino-2-deoxyglucuronate dehydrogenase
MTTNLQPSTGNLQPSTFKPSNFALIGAAGYIAPRHLRAIRDTGNVLVAAVDPKDAVGVLDQYSYNTRFFTEIERFDRHLEKLRRGPEESRVHWVSVCSPNYLHDAHCRLALRTGADVICEKPIVINPWNLDALEELEAETGRSIHTVLQLRVHPQLVKLRETLAAGDAGRMGDASRRTGDPAGRTHDVVLTYITARGPWYHVSWKGAPEKSGGIALNIGVHFFDLLLWLFGPTADLQVHHSDPQRMAGYLELEHARVRWFLSIDPADLPFPVEPGARSTFRSITVDGEEIEFTEGFTGLHTKVYEETLAGRGFRIADARPAIDLVYRIRTAEVQAARVRDAAVAHPLLNR